MHETRLTFLAAAAEARAVLVVAEVEERWSEDSALSRMSIGALAAHLARAITTVHEYLATPVAHDDEPVSAAAYYASIEGLADVESEVSVGVRARAAQGAAAGVRALIESFDNSLAHLRRALAAESDDRLIEVRGKLVLALDEYLLTRILELTLHTDDLCVSVGRPTPALSGLPMSIGLLVDLAELRHGEVAVLRALARRERDPGNVLRVL